MNEEIKPNDRVVLINPGGYDNYQGTVTNIRNVGNQNWADINWDMPHHPCTTPMMTKHLKKIIQTEEKIPGGLAKGKTLQDLADKHKIDIDELQKELIKGIKIELEHTSDKSVAREIAMDHLFENPKYYAELKKAKIDEEQELIKGESEPEDLNSLQNLYDNPDTSFAVKNYGSIRKYKDMIKKKIDDLKAKQQLKECIKEILKEGMIGFNSWKDSIGDEDWDTNGSGVPQTLQVAKKPKNVDDEKKEVEIAKEIYRITGYGTLTIDQVQKIRELSKELINMHK